ncbi:MAG: fibronectin type III domain-containing protein [bacterium]
MFYWGFGTDAYGSSTQVDAKFTISYPIQDGIQADIVVQRLDTEQARITYFLNGESAIGDKTLRVYDDRSTAYKEPTRTNFPFTDSSTNYINIPDGENSATHVDFYITAGNGYSFTFYGRTVIFKWEKNSGSDDVFYVQTDGIKYGNIYPISLYTEANGKTKLDTTRVFLGVDTSTAYNEITKTGFGSTPFANADPESVDPDVSEFLKSSLNIPTEGKGVVSLGHDAIDQTQRPITDYPGTYVSGVNIMFDTPKTWVSDWQWSGEYDSDGEPIEDTGEWVNNSRFEFIETSDADGIQAILNVGTSATDVKGAEIRIPNVYESYNDSDAYDPNTAANMYFDNNVAANYAYSSNKTDGSLNAINSSSGNDIMAINDGVMAIEDEVGYSLDQSKLYDSNISTAYASAAHSKGTYPEGTTGEDGKDISGTSTDGEWYDIKQYDKITIMIDDAIQGYFDEKIIEISIYTENSTNPLNLLNVKNNADNYANYGWTVNGYEFVYTIQAKPTGDISFAVDDNRQKVSFDVSSLTNDGVTYGSYEFSNNTSTGGLGSMLDLNTGNKIEIIIDDDVINAFNNGSVDIGYISRNDEDSYLSFKSVNAIMNGWSGPTNGNTYTYIVPTTPIDIDIRIGKNDDGDTRKKSYMQVKDEVKGNGVPNFASVYINNRNTDYVSSLNSSTDSTTIRTDDVITFKVPDALQKSFDYDYIIYYVNFGGVDINIKSNNSGFTKSSSSNYIYTYTVPQTPTQVIFGLEDNREGSLDESGLTNDEFNGEDKEYASVSYSQSTVDPDDLTSGDKITITVDPDFEEAFYNRDVVIYIYIDYTPYDLWEIMYEGVSDTNGYWSPNMAGGNYSWTYTLDNSIGIQFDVDDNRKTVDFTGLEDTYVDWDYSGDDEEYLVPDDTIVLTVNNFISSYFIDGYYKVYMKVGATTYNLIDLKTGGDWAVNGLIFTYTIPAGTNRGDITFSILDNRAEIEEEELKEYVPQTLPTQTPNVFDDYIIEDDSDILEYSSVTVVVANLVPSVIYGSSKITLDSNNGNFKNSGAVELDSGTIYTYPKYKIIALDDDEFYIEITPYQGYGNKMTGYYTVRMADTAPSLENSIWALYEDSTGGANTILITVPLNANIDQIKYFDIYFSLTPDSTGANLGQMVLNSQAIAYKPDPQDVAFGTIENFEIVSSYILYDEDDPNYVENLFLSVKWDIGTETTVSSLASTHDGNLKVNYYLNKATEVGNYDEFEFAGVELEFTVESNTTTVNDIKNGVVYRTPELKKDGVSTYLSSVIDSGNTTNTSTKTFTSSRIENVAGNDKTILEANVTFKIPVSEKNVSVDKLILEYPELYLINVNGSYIIKPVGDDIIEEQRSIDTSLPDTLTLNGLTEVLLATPQELRISDYDETYMNVRFTTVDYQLSTDLLYKYDQIMLKNIGRQLTNDSIYYDLFVTQSKNLFDKIIATNDEGKDFREVYEGSIVTYDLEQQQAQEAGLDVSMKNVGTDGTTLIDALRADKVVELYDLKQNFGVNSQQVNIQDLDRNETYYVIAVTRIIPSKISDGTMLPEREDTSAFSNIITITTLNGDNDLTDDNKIPAAPTNFEAKDTSQSATTLSWDIPVEVDDVSSEGVLEYQFIRTQGYEIDTSFYEDKVAYEFAWENIPEEVSLVGFKTDGDAIYKFDKEELEFEDDIAPSSQFRYINYADNTREIKDYTLVPNTIYFYYVRAVRVTDGQDQAYSVWVPLTLTTPNVEAPENLQVEYEEEFDTFTEVMISFDLPQMDITDIGESYLMEYAIREDIGDWLEFNSIDPKKCTITIDDVTGAIRVMYKVTGLEPGISYKIKVRIYNTELESYSMYSNEVEYRTEYDNDAGVDEEKVENWLGAFDDLIDQLKKDPYWKMEDSYTSTKVYYRQDYFPDIVNFTNGSLIPLDGGQENTFKQFYLPASAAIEAFNGNKGFKIQNGDMSVIISAQAIDPNSVAELKAVSEELALLATELEDYFVKITLTFEYSLFVMGNKYNSTPVVGIYLDVITTDDEIANMEERMIFYIEELADEEAYTTDYEKEIRRLVEEKEENNVILRYMNSTFDALKAELALEMEEDIQDMAVVTQEFTTLPKQILITNPKETGYSYQAYKGNLNSDKTTSWVETTVRDYLEEKALYTNTTGRYGFTSSYVSIDNVGSIDTTGSVIELYSKYGLSDYIGYNGTVNLNDVMTRDAILGTFASLAGCPSYTAPIDFFASKGITVTARDGDSPMTLEETIYLAMKVYEIKTGTSADQIKVRNYNLSSGVTNITSRYKQSIQVAYDLNLFTKENADARASVNAGELLQMANALSKVTNI